jgi:thiosulfate dehydrogenase (quinone) large subunit
VAVDAGRRALLARGALAGVVLVGTGVVGAAIGAAERLLGSEETGGSGVRTLPAPATTPRAHQANPSGRRTRAAGTRIGSLGDIPVGQAAAFTTHGGEPAVAVRLGQRRVVAYSAVCTHAGCTVSYDSGSRLLACPCHGAEFDPARGATPVAGPAATALPAITLHVAADGGLYLPPSG